MHTSNLGAMYFSRDECRDDGGSERATIELRQCESASPLRIARLR